MIKNDGLRFGDGPMRQRSKYPTSKLQDWKDWKDGLYNLNEGDRWLQKKTIIM